MVLTIRVDTLKDRETVWAILNGTTRAHMKVNLKITYLMDKEITNGWMEGNIKELM